MLILDQQFRQLSPQAFSYALRTNDQVIAAHAAHRDACLPAHHDDSGAGRRKCRGRPDLVDDRLEVPGRLIRMFAEGRDGFKGGLSAANYRTITDAAPATATRDLAELVELEALRRQGELKHTRYYLNVGQ
jgi:Fic family protein